MFVERDEVIEEFFLLKVKIQKDSIVPKNKK